MKEDLVSIRESRDSSIIVGVAQIACGLVLASLLARNGNLVPAVSILGFFTVFGVISFAIALRYRRDYQNKLKGLKKSEKGST
ncbi:unnamed protein product [marine sediment metagenome]|uniref:Uncharacterized protein n=1 Tax=marine sediment metagenome TaxID=412755 RepID=X1J8E8_9ZZZZ